MTFGAAVASDTDQAKSPLVSGQRVLFLGDSITAAGDYIAYIEAYGYIRKPDAKTEVINLGLPSETVSGLSEASHPWPRPTVHERLQRALDQLKPTWVVACYGMNDGIYQPFDETRFKLYQDGVRKLTEACLQAGARVTLVTPPPFDAKPLGTKVSDESGPGGFQHPYAHYDEVLVKYARWLSEMQNDRRKVQVVDTRTPLVEYLAERRKTEPAFLLAGDGVHLNELGHVIIAARLLTSWGEAPEPSLSIAPNVDKGELQFTWSPRLLPRATDRWKDCPLEWRELARRTVTLSGISGETYRIDDGLPGSDRVELKPGETTFDAWLTSQNAAHIKASNVLSLVQKRQHLLANAYLTSVGHKRPDMPAGLPLEEALIQAKQIEQRIQALIAEENATWILRKSE